MSFAGRRGEPGPPAPISRRENLAVAAWAALLLLVSFAPIWVGYASAVDGWRFTGFHASELNDLQSYMAWIRQARDGHLLFVDKFTSEPHGRVIFHPLFWAIGAAARFTGASMIAVWHLAQGLAVVLLAFAIHRFSAELSDSRPTRALTLVLATTASGLGWLFPGAASTPITGRPIDLWMVEANQFRAICSSILTLTVALALMLWASVLMLRYLRTGRLRCAARAGGLTLLLAAVHPYDVVTLYAVFGVWALAAGRRYWLGMVILVAVSAPYLLYGYLAVERDPVLNGLVWSMEMPTVSAHLIGWGLPPALALAALLMPAVWRDHRHVKRLGVWIAVNLALLLPLLEFRRKLIWGLHVVFCALAAMAVRELALCLTIKLAERPRLRRQAGAALALAGVAFMAVGSLRYFKSQLLDRSWGRFLPAPVVASFERLDALAAEDDVVVAGPALAGFIPGWTGATAFWGHWAQTIDLASKIDLARRLTTADSGLDAQAVAAALAEHDIRFIVLDAASASYAKLGRWPIPILQLPVSGVWPVEVERLPVAPFVRSVHRDDWVEILEVRPDSSPLLKR